MSKMIRCDRCGKTVYQNDCDDGEITGVEVYNEYVHLFYDLCEECFAQFQNVFMKGLEEGTDVWKDAGDEPPAQDGTYLVTMDGEVCGEDSPITSMCGFEGGRWDEEGHVLFWKPLPEPHGRKERG